MDTLVDVDWLRQHLEDPDLRILECSVAFEIGEGGAIRFFSGREDWERGHLPGAGFADLMGALSDPRGEHHFTLPSAEAFAAAMEALGVGEGTRVVLYDRSFTMWATRVWWMLRAVGFDDAAVLDGGLTAWEAAGGALSTEAPTPRKGKLPLALRPELFADKQAVRRVVETGSACLIDALTPEMFRGEVAPYARPGHIAGAINVPAFGIVDPESRRFLSEAALRERFAGALEGGRPIVTYCGGGIAATADAFVLHRLGCEQVAVYDGSLSEWSADPALPMETASPGA